MCMIVRACECVYMRQYVNGMYVCMYVCFRVHRYACIFMCVCLYMRVNAYVYMYICMHSSHVLGG